ncbi:uncharacterized protein LOC106170376 [Lingula anatina]|uniref:Uncharacterized protein LOC106170376 n=1 Tax=Lingula anatina TaxID=7574 RepID=A0A1S3J5K6_LINAN|nr:uncharacterized protein LOC106170376 [Lingula anatina]|eukprot:XP_013405675.1 uncharacterized protein LOC106170376 [Lingula anatina]
MIGRVGAKGEMSPSWETPQASPIWETSPVMKETLVTEILAPVMVKPSSGTSQAVDTTTTDTLTGLDQEAWTTLEATLLSYGDAEALDSSSIYARSVQKTSGLFNPSDSLKETLKLDLFADEECDDLLMTCMKQTVLKEGPDPDTSVEAASDDFENDWLFNETEFLDDFADLSKYIEQNTMPVEQSNTETSTSEAHELVPTIDNVTIVTEPSQSSESFGTVDLADISAEVDHNDSDSTDSNSTIDHDYSRGKKRKTDSVTSDIVTKRAKVNSVASESDTESVITTASGSNDRYGERRRKNNIASKRSREQRKNKYIEMEEEAVRLAKENSELQAKIELLEKATKDLKQVLVQKLTSGSK